MEYKEYLYLYKYFKKSALPGILEAVLFGTSTNFFLYLLGAKNQ